MHQMIIREWTDPEDSMHPGLDGTARRLGSAPLTGDSCGDETRQDPTTTEPEGHHVDEREPIQEAAARGSSIDAENDTGGLHTRHTGL